MTAQRSEDIATPVQRYMQVEDSEFAAVSEGRIRIRIGAFIFMGALMVAIVRLAELSLISPQVSASVTEASQAATRADIVDRNGRVMATTLATYALYARPRYVWDTDETTEALMTVFPAEELYVKYSNNRLAMWLSLVRYCQRS